MNGYSIGLSMLFLRISSDHIQAYTNVCPHQGTQNQWQLIGSNFRCNSHNNTYDSSCETSNSLPCFSTNIDGDNLIGMVQSNLKKDLDGKQEVYSIGCVGYIEYHSSTPDGRYLINLKGITRFKIKNEINTNNLYRKFKVDYEDFTKDFGEEEKININSIDLIYKTKKLFEKHQLITDLKIV